jgi:hypothetical protein
MDENIPCRDADVFVSRSFTVAAGNRFISKY